MVDRLKGHWKLCKSENVDEYLNAMGYNIVYKQLNKRIPYKLDIGTDGGEWTFSMTSPVKNNVWKIRLNETYKEVCLDGRKREALHQQDGDKIVSDLQPIEKGDHHVTISYEVSDDDLLVQTFTIVALNIVSKRYLERYVP